MQKIRIDFDNPGLPQHISAVENDSQSRFFQATLYENGKAYTAPAGATYSIMYHGFGPQNQGWYDTINDGASKRAACAVSGNVVTCEIARQALQVPGHVSIVLCVTTGNGYMLKSWPIECDCKNDRYDSTTEIQSFFYVTQVSNESWTQAIQAVEELKNIIDPTLSLSGKAADAKATGDAIGQLNEDFGDISKVGIYKYGYYINRNNVEVEENNFNITDIVPISCLKYPISVVVNSAVKGLILFDDLGKPTSYYVGSSGTLTLNSREDIPNVTENDKYIRFSCLATTKIYVTKNSHGYLSSLISSMQSCSDNLFIKKPYADGGSIQYGVGFYNDLNIVKHENMILAAINVEEGKTYTICRKTLTPSVWRDNFLAITMRDKNGSLKFNSNAFAFDESASYHDKGYPPYTNSIYNKYENCVVVTVPKGKNINYIAFNLRIGGYDFTPDGSVVVVEGNKIEEDAENRCIYSINGYDLRDAGTRKIAKSAKYPLLGKTWVALGDSITERTFWAKRAYHDYIAEDTGVSILNYGASGTGYKQDFDYGKIGKGFPDRVLLLKNVEFDICTIFGSVNDSQWYLSNLGTAEDIYEKGVTDSLGACINKAIDNFYSVCPLKKLALITPIPSGKYPTMTKDNPMSKYADLIIEIGKLRGIPVLDLYHSSGLRPWDDAFCVEYFTSDDTRAQDPTKNNIHPNSMGHKWIAPMIEQFVKSLII